MVRIDDIIEYVLYTPCNPNKTVLKGLLESYLKDNGGGGGTVILDDNIIVPPNPNGESAISPEKPKPGDSVTITTNAKEGYIVSNVIVVDLNGNMLPVTDNEDGTYTFTQPEDGSTVIPIVDYDSIEVDPDNIIIYNGGGVNGW